MKAKKTHRPYELQEYDPKWKETFLSTAEKIRPLFGDSVIAIEHIGSTSVEGMVAKPQVDILVVVKDLDLVPLRYDSIRSAGFTPRGREYVGNGDEYITQDSADGKRIVSIHVLQEGWSQIADYRALREYLKTHPEDRELYIRTKRDLYSKHKDDFHSYDSGKTQMISFLVDRARKWYSSLM
ncbi:MAG TPA: GrpB family protein [Candidatus Paceibacterota bacterium]|nr:GrpB family protein [Candidatus Paceibacterota bacterium]